MSKSSTLKVRSLFKLRSPEKEKKELKRSEFLQNAADTPGDLSGNPGSLSPGDNPTLPGDSSVVSPKEKKKRRLLSLSLKRKKSKSKDRERGEEVFFPDTDELESFSSHKSFDHDQMSISTECSFRTDSDWTSIISFDMNQEPHSPNSPSKLFKVHHLAVIGGRDLRAAVYNILPKIITNRLAEQYSLYGRKGKKNFSAHKHLVAVIFRAVRKNQGSDTLSDTEIQAVLGDWLKHAKCRKDKSANRGQDRTDEEDEP